MMEAMYKAFGTTGLLALLAYAVAEKGKIIMYKELKE